MGEVELKHLDSDGGAYGYIAEIYFKNGARKFQIYMSKKSDVVAECEEMSMFIIGRNAKNNELVSDWTCKMGGCYCICCKHWALVTALYVLFGIAYIGASYGIAYARNGFDK